MSIPDDPLEALMARMAAGELAALWEFHETFETRLRGVVLSNVRSMGRRDVAADTDRIKALTADAAAVIFHRSAGWKPGGAKPWNWAGRAIRSMIAADIGHRSVELGHDDTLEGEVNDAPAGGADLTLERFVSLHSSHELFGEAYCSVSSDRDQLAAWLFRVQKVNDDPSPAHTVSDEFGITAAHARKIHERHFSRVHALIWSDDRYAPLRTWKWFEA